MADETVPPREDAAPATGGAAIDPRLLEILVCPVTKTSLLYVPERQELISRAGRVAYPIRDGIPVMLADEARPLSDDEVRLWGRK